MKEKILSASLAALLLVGSINPVAYAQNGLSNKAKVEKLVNRKIVEGDEKGNLNLNDNIKRSEITKIIVYALGKEAEAKKLQPKQGKFSDVSISHWANGVISYASEEKMKNGQNIVNGYPDGTFKPEDNITNAELLKMLVVATKKDLNSTEIKNAQWPKDYIKWAEEEKIIGKDTGIEKIEPSEKATRETAFVALSNGLEKIEKKTNTNKEEPKKTEDKNRSGFNYRTINIVGYDTPRDNRSSNTDTRPAKPLNPTTPAIPKQPEASEAASQKEVTDKVPLKVILKDGNDIVKEYTWTKDEWVGNKEIVKKLNQTLPKKYENLDKNTFNIELFNSNGQKLELIKEINVTGEGENKKLITLYLNDEKSSYIMLFFEFESKETKADRPSKDKKTGTSLDRNLISNLERGSVPIAGPIPRPKEERNRDKLKFLTTEEIDKIGKDKIYPDGEYYGDGYGHHKSKAVPLKVTIKDNKIVDIAVVKEELIKADKHHPDIDDGLVYLRGYEKVRESILKNQNHHQLAYSLCSYYEAKDKIVRMINENKNNVEKSYEEAFNQIIGEGEIPKEKFIIGNAADLENNIHVSLRNYASEKLGYKKYFDQIDGISGATDTAKGTVEAVAMALKKADPAIQFTNLIITGEFGTREGYTVKENSKLDLDKLQVELTMKNSSEKKTVPYSDFDQYGLKVINVYTGKEVKNGSEINSNLLGTDINRGLYLAVIHEDSNTIKRCKVIYVEEERVKFEPLGIYLKVSGSDNLINLTPFDPQDFAQKVKVSPDVYKAVSSLNGVEFILKYREESNEERETQLVYKKENLKEALEHNREIILDIDTSKISSKSGKKIKYKYTTYNLNIIEDTSMKNFIDKDNRN